MAGKKSRFEVWGLVDGEWAHAQNFEDLAKADAYCRKNKGLKGVDRMRITDTTGELTDRDYNCKVKEEPEAA